MARELWAAHVHAHAARRGRPVALSMCVNVRLLVAKWNMAEPTKSEISQVFKRLRGIGPNKVSFGRLLNETTLH